MNETTHLSSLQMAIMRVLWQRQEATTAEVHEALKPERNLAFTTVATVISRLVKKGIIGHRAEGRQYIYRALVSEPEVRRSMVADLVERLFEGNTTALVNHLLKESEIDGDDLERLRDLMEEGPDAGSPADASSKGGHTDV